MKISKNKKIFSVSEFNLNIKKHLEFNFKSIWINGEISNLKNHSSGHIYFSLKDEQSQISAILFKNYASNFLNKIKEGTKVLIFGEVNVYVNKGNYQLIVRSLKEEGQGNLNTNFNYLKDKLKKEGLFNNKNKKKLPFLPLLIAFITSPTSAAVFDFISILKRRNWVGKLIILPCNVQGKNASFEIINQLLITKFINDLDLIVIGRGGGSSEDLSVFNEENLIRSIAGCKCPIISAIGHEIDFTLTDFVADKRAETPSAAAELISSIYLEFKSRVENIHKKINLRYFLRILENYYLKLDDQFNSLNQLFYNQFNKLKNRLDQLENQFISYNPENTLKNHYLYVNQIKKRLYACNPTNILNRGYAWIQDSNKVFIKNVKDLKKEQVLMITLKDGTIKVKKI